MYTRRNRKWLGLTAMLAVLALVAGACGSDEEAADDGLFKIAVVAPSASNDLAFLLVPVVTFLLNRTTFGLNVRAVGENPAAADSLGVSVARVRYTTILLANGLAGLAGAVLAIELGIFQQNLTNGQGFIAIALVYFGAWRPVGVMGGALLFGMVSATVLQWKTLGLVSGARPALPPWRRPS